MLLAKKSSAIPARKNDFVWSGVHVLNSDLPEYPKSFVFEQRMDFGPQIAAAETSLGFTHI
jgi:hypothetical protein